MIRPHLTIRIGRLTQQPTLGGQRPGIDHLTKRQVSRPLVGPGGLIPGEPHRPLTISDEERATITNVIDALVTKAKLRLITGGAG